MHFTRFTCRYWLSNLLGIAILASIYGPIPRPSRDHYGHLRPVFFVCSVPRGIPRFVLSFSPRYSVVFFLLFPGLSLSGYLLGSCVRMASGHPAPHCPVSGTFAAGVLLSAPRCPVRASFASAFSFLRLLAPHCMRVSLSPISYLRSAPRCPVRASSASALPFFVCPFPGIECRLSFRPFRRLLFGFHFVHSAGCHPAA